MECPVCRESMVVIEYRSIELDYCVGCMGVWFDRGEIELLCESAGVSLDPNSVIFPRVEPASREIVRPCPLCGKSMYKVTPAGGQTVLDQCPDLDGIWFDSGELAGTIKDITGTESGSVISLLREFLGEALAESKS